MAYGLFFAAFAQARDNDRFCRQGRMLARQHGLRNAVQSPGRAHITLCSLNRHEVLDQAVIDAAKAAAARFPCPELPVVFDRAASFAADGAFMLLGDQATQAAVARLRRPLVTMLRRFGLRPEEVKLPHMTMVYNCGKRVDEQPIPPMAWTLRRFALVLSHVGNRRHDHLGEWALPRT
jgi:RNA 2',3'-cyclic 3'-phosphodiesterase